MGLHSGAEIKHEKAMPQQIKAIAINHMDIFKHGALYLEQIYIKTTGIVTGIQIFFPKGPHNK